jgi:hypothetical protein
MVLSFRFYVLGVEYCRIGSEHVGNSAVLLREIFSFQDLNLHVKHDECRSVRIAGFQSLRDGKPRADKAARGKFF